MPVAAHGRVTQLNITTVTSAIGTFSQSALLRHDRNIPEADARGGGALSEGGELDSCHCILRGQHYAAEAVRQITYARWVRVWQSSLRCTDGRSEGYCRQGETHQAIKSNANSSESGLPSRTALNNWGSGPARS